MSGLHAKPKENTRQIIADLDDLFTEHGIAISGDGETLKLLAGSHHTHKNQQPISPKKTLKGPQLRFEGAEHTAIGDSTLLRFIKDAPRYSSLTGRAAFTQRAGVDLWPGHRAGR
jgi:hypothetical protein